MSQATPLPAYLRVPLQWYHSMALAFFPGETNSQIHKVYTPPAEQHAMRRFCGFCGTPLSYWSEKPPSEAEFIYLTLGSLSPRDLADLEDLGLLPDPEDEDEEGEEELAMTNRVEVGQQQQQQREEELVPFTMLGTVGALPWFDALTEGSRLGKLRRTKGRGADRSGTVRVEWEIVEWTEDNGPKSPRNGKRKLEEFEPAAGSATPMETVQR